MEATDLFSFNRRISEGLCRALVRTPLKPNHVTTLSLLSGAFAALFASLGTRAGLLGAAFFLHLRYILDNCDGALARAKGLTSRLGMWYDFCADVASDILLWWGLALGVHRSIPGPWPIALALIATIGSFIHLGFVLQDRLGDKVRPSAVAGGRNEAVSVLYALNHDGDPTLLAWVLALIGQPALFLILSCLYIHAMWLSTLVFSHRASWRI